VIRARSNLRLLLRAVSTTQVSFQLPRNIRAGSAQKEWPANLDDPAEWWY
jgi:hypothetical protein